MKATKLCLILIIILAFSATLPTFAKRPPGTSALEKAVPVAEASRVEGATRISLETGAVLSMGALRHRLDAAAPEDMGRQFLRDHARMLGLKSSEGEDLRLHAVREGLSGTTVRFRQVINGVPVYGAEIAVTYNRDGEARTVSSTYKPAAALAQTAGEIDAAKAGRIALAYMTGDLESQDLLGFAKSQDLVIDVEAGQSRLAHRVQFEAPTPLAGWEILVDATTGEVLRAVDRNYYATGSGLAFLPDPLSSATVAYGTVGYVDGPNDDDTPELTAESFNVTLLDITDTAGTFSFVGPWAELVDWDTPFKGDFSQANSTWTDTREADAFEAVNTYYHIDTYTASSGLRATSTSTRYSVRPRPTRPIGKAWRAPVVAPTWKKRPKRCSMLPRTSAIPSPI